jgi:hypothetical protein
VRLLIAAVLSTAVPASARDTIGVWQRWGAFRDTAPARCFAIARSVTRPRGAASVATWPRRGLRSSLHLRLSRPRDRAAPVTLTIGERRFQLVGTDRDAWAADGPSDRAIVAAMRGARAMSVEAVAANGRPFADAYPLAGAATAIDAAALACLRR